MTEETQAAEENKKPRKARKPKEKDWIRVQKSTGNGCINNEVTLIINEATGMCELRTNAPKSETDSSPEGERVQVFKVTGFKVINEPERDPTGEGEAKAEEPTGDDAEATASDEATATA